MECRRLTRRRVVPLDGECDAALRSCGAVRVDCFGLSVVGGGGVLGHRVRLVGGAGRGVYPKSGSSFEAGCGHIAGKLIADGNMAQAGIT